jgi:hypothetical protein
MAQKGKGHKKEGPLSEVDLQRRAIQEGIKYLISTRPELSKYSALMLNNINYDAVNNFVKSAKEEFEGQNISYEEQTQRICNGLANYAASGEILKDTARQTIIETGKEKELDRNVLEKIVDFFKPNKFEGTKYFEKARNAYSDMYDILSQDEMAAREMPELVKAAKAMKMYGFLDVALKSFKAHDMMDDKTYKMLSQELYRKTTVKSEEGRKGLENYIMEKDIKKENREPEKAVASIIGFAGILLVLFNLRITGAVIGGDNPVTMGIAGVFMLLFALLLYFRPLKRTFKK